MLDARTIGRVGSTCDVRLEGGDRLTRAPEPLVAEPDVVVQVGYGVRRVRLLERCERLLVLGLVVELLAALECGCLLYTSDAADE